MDNSQLTLWQDGSRRFLGGRIRGLQVFLRQRLPVWFASVREAYLALLPLTAMGALALSLAEIPYQPLVNWLLENFGSAWRDWAYALSAATMGVMGFLGTCAISYKVSGRLQVVERVDQYGQLTTAAVAGAAFLVVVFGGHPELKAFGYANVFHSIWVGIACSELMHGLARVWPNQMDASEMEAGLPLRSAIELSVAAALAMLAIGLTYGLLGAAFAWVAQSAPVAWLIEALQQLPAYGLNLVFVLVNQLFWILGINAGQVFLTWAGDPSSLLAAPWVAYDQVHATPMFMNAFAHLGGAGATWGVIAFCLLRSKDRGLRRLAWLSIVPAILNVNEPILFGLPMVLGFRMAVPFVLAPLLCAGLAIVAMQLGLMSLGDSVVTWSTPIFVSGYVMSGSWVGPLVQLLGVLSATAIYAPFLRRLEGRREEQRRNTFAQTIDGFMTPIEFSSARFLDRDDISGALARCLVRDCEADLGSSRVRLFYQPQHDSLGHVVGLEALLRWSHPKHGPVPPQAIVNLAEECELIHRIGVWVLNQACRDIARWRLEGVTGFTVSINMSSLQLESSDWTRQVRQAMREHGVSPHELDIEITEGRNVSTTERANQTLTELQALGVSLSMDDFGMGCTSLLYMHRFSMNILKLDGVLTRHVLNSPVDQDIIRCVCELARAQGMKVVAEYVETDAQKDLLMALGCNIFQGWLFSPALPFEAIGPYVKSCGVHAHEGTV